MEDLDAMVVSFQADMSDLVAAPDIAEAQFSRIEQAATTMSSTLGNLSGFDASNAITDVDIAQAKLTLIESKVNEARENLQSLQGSANVGEAVTGIPEAQAKLTLLESEAQKARESLQSLQSTSEEAGVSMGGEGGGGFSGAMGGAVNALMAFGPEAAMAIMSFQMLEQAASATASALLQPAATAEQTQTAFETLMHSTQAAKKEMEDLNSFAASTPFQTQSIDDAASKMLAFGFSTQDIIPDITAIGDSLSSLGKATPVALQSVIDIFGKIRANGKLTGGDMMQLSSLGIPAWKMLSDQMGVPVDKLQKMVSAGLIPADKALDGLRKGMEGTFGGGMAKQATTFNGLMSTLQSNVTLGMAAFGSPLLKMAEQGMTHLGDILSSKSFQDFAEKTGEKIGKVIENVGKFASNPAFAEFGKVLGGSIAAGLGKMLDYLASPAFGAFMKTVGDDLVVAIKVATPFVESIAGSVMKFAADIDTRVQPLIDKFMGWWKYAWPGVFLIFKGVWDSISGLVQIAWALISGIIKIGLDLLSGNWKQAWTDLKDMLAGVWQGMQTYVKGGLETLVGILWTAGAGIANALKWPFNNAWSTISGIFGSIGAGVDDLAHGNIPGALHAFHVPGFAGGTNSAPGGLSLVGEQGPELVMLPRGAAVLPLQGSSALTAVAGGGNASGDIHVHVYLDSQEVTNVVANNIVSMIRAQGPVGRIA